MNEPNSRIVIGNKYYKETNTNTLAQKLKTDIEGLSLKYTLQIAENAIESEENFEHTYTFCMHINKATLSQYEVKSQKKGGTIAISWRIAKISLKFKAERKFTVHARRRRSWTSGRRRCSSYNAPRGVTKTEITKIRNTLNNAAKPAISKSFRYRKRYVSSESQCPTTKTRPKRPIIDHRCRGPRRGGYRREKEFCP